MLSSSLLYFLAYFTYAITIFSHLQGWLGAIALKRFRKDEFKERRHLNDTHRDWPKVSVLKPVYGDEPFMREAFESFCEQHYPNFELIFGFHSADDKALRHIPYLKEKFPDLTIKTVINDANHGINGKVSNIINMYPEAQGEYLVVADSDMHVSPTYLKHVIHRFEDDNSRLITVLYAAHATKHTIAALLGCLAINLNFMPGVLLSRVMKRQDCLGATMALHRSMLEKIGGFESLVGHIADDALLGKLVKKAGGSVHLASVLTHTGVPEVKIRDLITHEIRWGRTTRTVSPFGYAASIMQLPLFWSFIALLLTVVAPVPYKMEIFAALIGLSWFVRALMERCIRKDVHYLNERIPFIAPFVLPIRDLMSGIIVLVSLAGTRVVWKGSSMEVSRLSKQEKELAKD